MRREKEFEYHWGALTKARDSLLSLLPVDLNAKDLKTAAVHIGKSLRTESFLTDI